MTDAASRASERLLEILAAKLVAEAGLAPDLAREAAASALSSPSVDEDELVPLLDSKGREIARIPFALVEEAFDDLDDEEDAKL